MWWHVPVQSFRTRLAPSAIAVAAVLLLTGALLGAQSQAAPSAIGARAHASHPRYSYRFPIKGCSVSYGHYHHDYPATDMFAARGCEVVAPVKGRIDEVHRHDHWSWRTNRGSQRGGLSFSIVGIDGVRYYGSHLEKLGRHVRPGAEVRRGQFLGRVGNSGDAVGGPTHLHFGISWPTRHGIWWVRRGEVYPWPYLDAWRSGHVHRSPVKAVRQARRRAGRQVPPCSVDC